MKPFRSWLSHDPIKHHIRKRSAQNLLHRTYSIFARIMINACIARESMAVNVSGIVHRQCVTQWYTDSQLFTEWSYAVVKRILTLCLSLSTVACRTSLELAAVRHHRQLTQVVWLVSYFHHTVQLHRHSLDSHANIQSFLNPDTEFLNSL